MNPRVLIHLGSCPVCGELRNNKSSPTSGFNSHDGGQYLAPLARDYGITANQLVNQSQAFRCHNCNAEYLDPWLGIEARNRVFVTGHAIHNMGWSNFQNRITTGTGPSLPLSPNDLVKKVERCYGTMDSYLEVGCPFQGLLLHLIGPNPDTIRRSWNLRGAMQAVDYERLPNPAGKYLRITEFVNIGFRKLLKHFSRVPSKSDGAALKIDNVSFSPLSSTKFWGANCSLYGTSCITALNSTLDVPVTSLESLRRIEDRHFHTIGIFNSLDHQDNPLDLLRLFLRIAKVVICMSHRAPYGIQHHIGLGEEFFQNLPNVIDNCKVQLLSDTSSKELLYLLSTFDIE